MNALFGAAAIIHFALSALNAQTPYQEPPSNRETKVNVDQYVRSWQSSEPKVTHGVLIERAILKAGDPNRPGPPGEVLEYHRELALATLEPGSTTRKAKHTEQEVLYIESGQGELQSAEQKWTLREGFAVLIPPGIEHAIVNQGGEPLAMILLTELYDSTVKLRQEILVRDRRDLPYAEPMVEWNYNAKMLFGPKDGLHSNEHVLLVTMEPMTLGAPHPHPAHWEELWLKLPPDASYAFLGSEVRVQQPNSAFLVPPNGKTVHSVVNLTDRPLHWFYSGHYTEKVDYPDWVYHVPSVQPVPFHSSGSRE